MKANLTRSVRKHLVQRTCLPVESCSRGLFSTAVAPLVEGVGNRRCSLSCGETVRPDPRRRPNRRALCPRLPYVRSRRGVCRKRWMKMYVYSRYIKCASRRVKTTHSIFLLNDPSKEIAQRSINKRLSFEKGANSLGDNEGGGEG